VKKMGYTDDQVREIISGKKLLPGGYWGDFSGVGLPKIKIPGEGELSEDEVNRIATERKKRGEAEKSAQELYMRAVEERKSAEHDQARARIEDSMKIIESKQSETQAAMAQGIFDDARLDQIGNKIRELGQHGKGTLQKATTTEIDLFHLLQLETNRGHRVAASPEMFTREVSLLSAQSGKSNGALPFHFRNPITAATGCLGGIAMHICTWSGIRCPSKI